MLAMTLYVYILECSDDSFYVGSTPSLERRVAEHNAGEGGSWTARRVPARLVFSESFSTFREEFEAERQIKGWRREKNIALTKGRLDLLPKFARTAK